MKLRFTDNLNPPRIEAINTYKTIVIVNTSRALTKNKSLFIELQPSIATESNHRGSKVYLYTGQVHIIGRGETIDRQRLALVQRKPIDHLSSYWVHTRLLSIQYVQISAGILRWQFRTLRIGSSSENLPELEKKLFECPETITSQLAV